MGECFGDTLYAREVDYLVTQEWAQAVEDIIWRRTKLGLYLQHADNRQLQSYIGKLLETGTASVDRVSHSA